MSIHDPKIIRDIARHRRQSLSLQQRQQATQLATANLVQSSIFRNSQHIGCYIATADELSTKLLIEQIFNRGKKCYLPVVDDTQCGKMSFVAYHKQQPLQANRFGILEPADKQSVITATTLELVIMPLLAFDKNGHRLGSGSGYYDRYFLDRNRGITSPILCGFAYDCQQVNELYPQTWDVPMDVVITSRKIHYFS